MLGSKSAYRSPLESSQRRLLKFETVVEQEAKECFTAISLKAHTTERIFGLYCSEKIDETIRDVYLKGLSVRARIALILVFINIQV